MVLFTKETHLLSLASQFCARKLKLSTTQAWHYRMCLKFKTSANLYSFLRLGLPHSKSLRCLTDEWNGKMSTVGSQLCWMRPTNSQSVTWVQGLWTTNFGKENQVIPITEKQRNPYLAFLSSMQDKQKFSKNWAYPDPKPYIKKREWALTLAHLCVRIIDHWYFNEIGFIQTRGVM